jgi:hypothetical protein
MHMNDSNTQSAPAAQVLPDAAAVRRVNSNGDITATFTPTRITAADLRNDIPGSVISTVRTTGSGGRPAVVGPNHIVTVDGMDMHVSTAVAMGYLRVTEAGGYADASNSPDNSTSPENANSEAPSGDSAVPFDQQAEDSLGVLTESIPGAMQDQIVNTLISGGQVDHRMAEAIGIDQAALTEGVARAHAAFVDQANTEIRKLGADPAEFAEWAQEHRGEDFKNAMRQHVYGRDPAAYNTLVERYLRTHAPSKDTLLNAGVKVDTTSHGEDLITVNGMQVSRKVAARLGWI